MKKSAFTMLELVFVIVVVGILSVVFIPKFERDNAGEAAYQIARHIRLAQHYALTEDRFNSPSSTAWKGTFWRITFINGTSGKCYQVWTDRDASGGTAPSGSEKALDPLTNKYVWGGTTCSDTQANVDQDVLLWKSFGVSTLTVCNGVGASHLAFDHLGRPGRVSLAGTGAGASGTFTPLASDCAITFTTNDGHDANLTVYRETGFVKVTAIDGVTLP